MLNVFSYRPIYRHVKILFETNLFITFCTFTNKYTLKIKVFYQNVDNIFPHNVKQIGPRWVRRLEASFYKKISQQYKVLKNLQDKKFWSKQQKKPFNFADLSRPFIYNN